jgi:hypothetical protein
MQWHPPIRSLRAPLAASGKASGGRGTNPLRGRGAGIEGQGEVQLSHRGGRNHQPKTRDEEARRARDGGFASLAIGRQRRRGSCANAQSVVLSAGLTPAAGETIGPPLRRHACGVNTAAPSGWESHASTRKLFRRALGTHVETLTGNPRSLPRPIDRFTRPEPLRPLKMKISPANGSLPRPSCTCKARPRIPRRISVWPVAIQIRTPAETGITRAMPPARAATHRD